MVYGGLFGKQVVPDLSPPFPTCAGSTPASASFFMGTEAAKSVSLTSLILLANSNQWYFNSLVKNSCHKTHCRCPHRLNLSFQSSRSWALPNIKVLKDEDLGFANSIPPLNETRGNFHTLHFHVLHCFEPPMEVTNFRLTRDPMSIECPSLTRTVRDLAHR